jgi:hypothetical protein
MRSTTSRLKLGVLAGVVATAGIAAACTDVNTDPNVVASIAFDPLPSSAIVAGDSLRDTLGIARPVHATAFNVQGAPLTTTPVRYHAADAGVRVDSVLGFVVADTARSTAIRIVAQAAGLQAAPDTLFIVPTPDTAFAVTARDSILYSLRDTTPTLSSPISLTVSHKTGGALTPVRGYLVTYQLAHPADTLLAQIVGSDGVHPSRVDTTNANGVTSHRIRVRQLRLSSATDSAVVLATVRYRGALVPGAPVRFVFKISPHP